MVLNILLLTVFFFRVKVLPHHHVVAVAHTSAWLGKRASCRSIFQFVHRHYGVLPKTAFWATAPLVPPLRQAWYGILEKIIVKEMNLNYFVRVSLHFLWCSFQFLFIDFHYLYRMFNIFIDWFDFIIVILTFVTIWQSHSV